VNVSVDVQGQKQIAAYLASVGRNINPIIKRAAKRAGTSTGALVNKTIRGTFGLKATLIRQKKFVEVKAQGNGSKVSMKAGAIPSIYFGARQSGHGKPTTAMVYKGKRETIKSGFIETMPGGHQGVFRRVGKARLPIREVMGPSIMKMLSVAGNGIDGVTAHAQKVLDERLNHELNRILNK
jgi:hypothetical protein